MIDLLVEDDFESDCESVDLQYDYTMLLNNNNNNKYKQHIYSNKEQILKSYTDYTLLKKQSPSFKSKIKDTFRKFKSF